MLLISNELGTRAPDPSNNYAAGLVPNWKENTQFFVRLFFSPQQCGADRKINNSWVTVFLGNTPTCAKVNKPQDEQGPNWSLPQGFLRFVVVRQPQAGNFTRKIMVATAKGRRGKRIPPSTHWNSAMSQSILQNYKFVTFAAFTPLRLTVARFSPNERGPYVGTICHAASRWPYGQLNWRLHWHLHIYWTGLSAMSQALQLMAVVFFSFPTVCTWNWPEPSSKLLHATCTARVYRCVLTCNISISYVQFSGYFF